MSPKKKKESTSNVETVSEPQVQKPWLVGRLRWIVAAVMIVGFYIYLLGASHVNKNPSLPSLDKITEITSIDFPAGAELRNARYENKPGGEYLYAQVEISVSDVDGFVRSLPAPKKISKDDRIGLTDDIRLAGTEKWWTPDASRKFLTVDLSDAEDNYTKKLLISMDDAEQAFIYLAWIKKN